MTTHLPQAAVVDALEAEWASLDALLADLGDDEWAAPTALPGWDVQANVAHVIGTEALLAGIDPPPVEVDVAALPHVRNDIAAFNERWVAALAPWPPADVLARFREVVPERLAALRAMGTDEWDAESFTPAGPDSYGRFMRIRVFDCWMHEQDVREAVGRPGHDHGPAVEQALDEIGTAMGYVVGKRAGAPDGAAVTVALEGPAARDLHVQVAGRAAVVDRLDRDPDVVVRAEVVAFTRLAGGRATPAQVGDAVRVEGDRELGRRLLDALGYTI